MRRIDAGDVAAAPLWTGPAPAEPAAPAADASIRDAHRQMEAQQAAAVERGYQEGHARGLTQAQERVRQETQAWQQQRERELDAAREQFEHARKRLESLTRQLPMQIAAEAARAEELAIETAYAAVTRLLGAGYVERSLMPALVRHAMGSLEMDVDTILLSAQDVELLQGMEGMNVAVDARLMPGQCRLETRLGSYDTGLDVRLDMLRQALLSGLAEHRAHQGEQ